METNREHDEDDAFVVAFGRHLAAERIANGLTLNDLSQRSGLSIESLHRYEHAKREIRLGDIRKVARVFGMTAAEMIVAAERRAENRPPAQ